MTASRTLEGRRVVVTRPESHGETLAAALTRAGALPIRLPLLEIEPVTRFDALGNLREYDHVVFTSANAVSCFAAQLSDTELVQLQGHQGIAVVGPATRRKLEDFDAEAAVMATEHVAESLVEALGEVAGKRILWPRAETVRPVLADSLRAAGATVTDVIVYRTVASVPADASRTIAGSDAVTFTSPSGVRAWSSALGTPVMRVVCLGPVTARAAVENGFRVDAVAAPYTLDGVMSALCRAFSSSPGTSS